MRVGTRSLLTICVLLLAFAGRTSAQTPTVTGISPASGPVGVSVAIAGSRFGATQGTSTVLLNGVSATVASWSDGNIIAIVPANATSGSFSVTVGGQVANSSLFTITPLPSVWSDADVGTVGVAGSGTYSNGTYTIVGGGKELDTADAMHFTYQALSGDGSMVARLVTLQGSGTPLVGVMIRETLAANSSNVYLQFQPGYQPYKDVLVSDRPSTGGGTAQSNYFSETLPYWLEVTRSGSTFTGYVSPDGVTWTQAAPSVTINMAQNTYIGLAVYGGSSTVSATATFDNVSVISATSPIISTMSATTGPTGSNLTISGSNFGVSQGSSLIWLGATPLSVTFWSNTVITATVPSGAASGSVFVSLSPSMNTSNSFYFTVTSTPLPSGWLDQDIGAAGVRGTATYSNGTFTVTGSGAGTSSNADAFHLVYLPLTGDGSIVARVASVTGNMSSLQHVSVMIRETTAPGALDALVNFYPNQSYLYYRTTTNASATYQNGTFIASGAPYWVKLVRTGSTFTGYMSLDGLNWSPAGTATVNMAQNVYIGFAVCGTATTTTTATFDNVEVGSDVAAVPTITAVSATSGSVGGQIVVTGLHFGASQGTSFVTLNNLAMTINQWSDTSIIATIPSGATSGHLFVTVAPSMDDSNFINFTVTANPLPAGWLDQDIGIAGLVGSASYSNGVFTVTGAGQTISGTPDGFHFAYLPLSGDGSITARLTSYSGSSPQVVLMMRESLNPGATDAFVQYIPNQIFLYDRPSTNANTVYSSGVGFVTSFPYWLKLTRVGNVFNGYISQDGINWTAATTGVTVTMAQNVYVGLAVHGTPTSLVSVNFDNVSVSSTAAPAPIITGLSATTGSVGSQIVVSGSSFGATQGSSLVTLNSVPVTINSWSDTSITITIPLAASSGPLVVMLGPTMVVSNYATFSVTTNPLPSGWFDQDIGSPGVTGRASYASGVFTVSGGGSITGTADAFHFAYQTLSGDGTIVARLLSSSGVGATQAGVMFRETLLANSTDAFAYWFPGFLSAYFYDRATTGGSTAVSNNVNVYNLPYWFKVTRTGNTFSGYVSPDGVYWTQVGTSVTISMAQNVYVGLADSNSTTNLGTAAFDNVAITTGTPPLNPTITSITPTSGTVGTSVTINGSNFGLTQGTSSVRFNGASATSISSWTPTQIIAAVPSNASTGPVTAIVSGIGTNTNFSLSFYNPVISSIAPPAASAQGVVTLTGSGFGAIQSDSQVKFNGVAASIASWSDTSVSVSVPNASGPVTVTVGGFTSNGVQFALIEPTTITGLAPATGSVGTTVTITGTGFGATQSNSVASFYLAAANIVSWSDTQIVATVPSGAATGNITVTVARYTAQGPVFSLTSRATLTDSLGNTTTYNAQLAGGWWHPSTWQGSGCSSCTLRGTKQDTFDSNGNILTSTDELGRTKTYTYDSNNNVLSVSQADGNGHTVTTSYTYNGFNEVLTTTDPLGNVTTNTYDANGNLLTVTTPRPNGTTNASVTQFAYNSLGQLTQITDPLTHNTILTYTPAGLIATIKDAQNNVTTYGYDTHGNRTSVTDALNHQTTFAYDTGDRLKTITYPDTTTTTFNYDTRGRRTSVTDQNGKTTTYAYDDADRLTSVTDAANHGITYGYDTENNLTSIKDANNNTTSFTPDAFGRITKTTFPSGYIETYNYDAVGNLINKTDRKNQLITYTYDGLNRLTQKSYPDTTTVNYTYDFDSRLTQVTDPTGTYQFTFDNMGRLTAATTSYTFLTARTFTTGYSYDAASNRTGLTDPENGATAYVYDTLNRLQTLTPPTAFSGTGSFGFSYDALNRRTQMTRPNNVATNYGYDNLSRLQSVLHQLAGSTIDGTTYTVDNAGNRTAKTDQRGAVTSNYSYDAIYELTGVTQGTNTTESYTYDPVGNRLSSLGLSPYIVNVSNQLTSTPSTSYTYDYNGNTLTSVTGSNTTTYAWDFENRLSNVTLPGSGGSVSFAYDPFGRRIKKVSPSATSVFAYDGDNLIEETNAAGAVAARYSQGLNIDEPLAMLRSGTTSYYQADGLGSIASLSSGAGSLAQTYTFDSFGRQTAATGSLTNPFQYTARESDAESGLYYYRARYYDPGTGRFLAEDPLRYRAGPDFYSYVSNNPVRFTDPTGQCPPQYDSVTRHHMECEQSAGGLQLTKENKCACHCAWAPEAPPGQGCMDVCMDCYAKSPTPYDTCVCFTKRLAGKTKEQAEAACSKLKKNKWWWPW